MQFITFFRYFEIAKFRKIFTFTIKPMKTDRRRFITSSAMAGIATIMPKPIFSSSTYVRKTDRFDPWMEIDPEALKFNIKTLGGLSGQKPVLAVVKNNAYGLGLEKVAPILDTVAEIEGFADVKTEACLALRAQGINKPILLMGMPAEGSLEDLIQNDIRVAVYTEELLKQLAVIAEKLGKSALVHVYVDTGMSRMGIPYQRALPLLDTIAVTPTIDIEGTFTSFTEDPDFDREQLARFQRMATEAKTLGLSLGKLHAASSNAIFHFSDSSLDMVRPGIGIYGAYPTYYEKEKEIAELRLAFRLKARVVRTQQLQPGDTVSYGRKYQALKPTWIATLPMGHADGYLRNAVNGAKVLVNGKLYAVIGAVSASHAIIEVGDEAEVKIGDEVTVYGPDHPEIHPNHVSNVTGDSVYDILMHLNPLLPKIVK